jgi:hypothetical protein
MHKYNLRTCAIVAMGKKYVDIGHPKTFQTFLRALNDANKGDKRI